MEKLFYGIRNQAYVMSIKIRLHRRKILQYVVLVAHIISAVCMKVYGEDDAFRYYIFTWGLGTIILATLFVKRVTKRLKRFFKSSLKKNFRDLKWGFIIALAGFGFVLALQFWNVISIVVVKNSFNALFLLYPVSVAGQQFIYTLQPRVLYRDYPKWKFMVCSVLFFTCAHLGFPMSSWLLASVCIAIPTAWLVAYKNNFTAAYILHLTIGIFALVNGFV